MAQQLTILAALAEDLFLFKLYPGLGRWLSEYRIKTFAPKPGDCSLIPGTHR